MNKLVLYRFVACAFAAALMLAIAGCAPSTVSSSAASSASSQDAAASSASSEASSSASSSSSSKASSSSSASSGASSASSTPEAEDEDATQTVTFALDGPVTVAHAGLFVAIENGYFEEEGIGVELSSTAADGADALVGSGRADFGLSTQDRLANNLGSANPQPITAVAAVVQHNTSGIIARVDDDITSPGQMAGKRYATRRQSVEQAMIARLVEDEGVDPAEVAMVSYTSGGEVAGLQQGSFDCAWAYDWWAVSEANLEDYPVSFFYFRNISPLLDYYTPVVTVNDRFAEDNPEVAKGFVQALKRGYEFAAGNPDEAADILYGATDNLDPNLAHYALSYLAGEFVEDTGTWGAIDEARWSAFNQWLIDYGLVGYQFDPTSGFTMEYLED